MNAPRQPSGFEALLEGLAGVHQRLSGHLTGQDHDPAELTGRAARACGRLLDAGIPLMNQTVLLRGINDDFDTMKRLNDGLLKMGVKPYYLHQGDMAAGTAHLRSTVARGRVILRQLCGCVSGYAIPHFMLDQSGGGGKIPLGPVGKPNGNGRRKFFS